MSDERLFRGGGGGRGRRGCGGVGLGTEVVRQTAVRKPHKGTV